MSAHRGDRPTLRVVGSNESQGFGQPVTITLRGSAEVEFFHDALTYVIANPPPPGMTVLDDVYLAIGIILQEVQDLPRRSRPQVEIDKWQTDGTMLAEIHVFTDELPPFRPRSG